MRQTTKLFFLPHTHWDREWYLTREKTQMMLLQVVDQLLAMLAKEQDYIFMLDGQTILLEDYLDIMPDRKEELASFIREGRLLIGPWYVLPDEFLISGESHIRNFLIGRQVCKDFGGAMEIGYLPDSFGHPSQMPQILTGLGMNEIVFWRGLGPDISRTEFMWEGRDGTEILAVNLPFSYGVAACMPEEPEAFLDRLRMKVDALAPLTESGVILLMNGVDHVAPQPGVSANIACARDKLPELDIRVAGLGDYLAELRKHGLPSEKTSGELRSGYRAYLLGGTLSTRIYLKRANFQAELGLEKHAEPFAAAMTIGFGCEYPSAELLHAWKLLLSNLPHDSICGCGIDEVHEEMMVRYRSIQDACRFIIDRSVGILRSHMAAKNDAFDGAVVVFNSGLFAQGDVIRTVLTTDRRLTRKVNYETGELQEYFVPTDREPPTGVVLEGPDGEEIEAGIREISTRESMHISLDTQPEMYRVTDVEIAFTVPKLPALGYALYNYRFTYGGAEASENNDRIENELFVVLFDRDASCLRLRDKRSGAWYEGLHVFEDGGDAGDEYTYSTPDADSRQVMRAADTTVETRGGACYPELVVRSSMTVPARLNPDRKGRSSETSVITIETTIALASGLPRVDFRTKIDNTAEDHRLRLLFPLADDSVTAFSESLFSVEERQAQEPDPDAYADWVERPSTFPQKSFATLHGRSRGLTVAVRGLPECEVVKRGEYSAIALTLLRAVGWLSRGDLLSRKGNGGWPISTPDAQCKGVHTFEYSLLPHLEGESMASVASRARRFAYPPLALELGQTCGEGAGRLRSLVDADRPEIVFSAFKKAEEREGWILRCWNSSAERVEANLSFGFAVVRAFEVSLSEVRERSIELRSNSCSIALEPWKILTIELETTQGDCAGP